MSICRFQIFVIPVGEAPNRLIESFSKNFQVVTNSEKLFKELLLLINFESHPRFKRKKILRTVVSS